VLHNTLFKTVYQKNNDPPPNSLCKSSFPIEPDKIRLFVVKIHTRGGRVDRYQKSVRSTEKNEHTTAREFSCHKHTIIVKITMYVQQKPCNTREMLWASVHRKPSSGRADFAQARPTKTSTQGMKKFSEILCLMYDVC
jgi:hypothetical protein